MPFLRAALINKKAKPETEALPDVEPVVEVQVEEVIAPEVEAIPDVEPVIEESVEADDDTTEDSQHDDGLASLEVVPPDGVPEDSPNLPDVQEVQEEPQEPEQTESESETEDEANETDGLPEEILEAVTDTSTEPESELEPEAEDKADESDEAKEADGLSEGIIEAVTDTSTEPESEQEPEQVEPESETEDEANESEEANEADGLAEEILEAVTDTPPEPESELEPEPEPAPTSHKDYSGDTLNYDFTSGERYVDTVSTKTEFDKMLDELSAISKDLLDHEVEKFAIKFTGKFQGDNDKAEADAKKYTAFLGGYITNAAMTLYDNGYRDAAIKQLDQAKSILEARKKLEEETNAIKTRVEEDDDTVDLTDILGLFGD